MTAKGYIIDEYCKHKSASFVEKDNSVFACTLNQTDLGSNKNKYYIMQLLKNGNQYVHYIRYGRISEPGKANYTIFADESDAISAFKKQFKSKTGNKWGQQPFTKKDGKYFLSEIGYDEELKDVKLENNPIPDSKLDTRVQELIKLISDVNMMNKSLINLEIDVKKMPLGKIKQKQLDSAKETLNKIQELLDKKSNSTTLEKLSSEYYTLIPMGTGRRKPKLIDNKELLDKYKETLEELTNIVIGVQIVNNVKTDENPIDAIYKDINTDIKPLDKNSRIWSEIEKYVANTHGKTHSYKLDIIDIYEVSQHGKKEKFDEYCKNIDNRMLLYHGTPQSCVLSIFKRDFYLDPSKLKDTKVQIAGKMFGYGVYFADMCSKSFGYTRADQTNDIGCLILGEIALGTCSERQDADYYITSKTLEKEKCQSTKGIGKWSPSSYTEVDGVKIPNGKVAENKKATVLRYNEYIVYDINQILIKYLIVVKNVDN